MERKKFQNCLLCDIQQTCDKKILACLCSVVTLTIVQELFSVETLVQFHRDGFMQYSLLLVRAFAQCSIKTPLKHHKFRKIIP